MEKQDKSIRDWNLILSFILNSDINGSHFMFDERSYSFVFVAHPISRLGFMLIWDVDTHDAFNVSRIKVPNNFDFIDINDETSFSQVVPVDLKF